MSQNLFIYLFIYYEVWLGLSGNSHKLPSNQYHSNHSSLAQQLRDTTGQEKNGNINSENMVNNLDIMLSKGKRDQTINFRIQVIRPFCIFVHLSNYVIS